MRVRIIGFALVGVVVAACQEVAPSTPEPSPTPPQIVGVSAPCAAAFLRAIEGREEPGQAFDFEPNILAVLMACPTVGELESASRQLGIEHDWSYEATSKCELADFNDPGLKNAAICLSLPKPTPTPVPTPTPLSSLEAQSRTLCDKSRPAGLYGVTSGVTKAKGLTVRDGVHLVFVEFKDLDAKIGPLPALQRGYIYDPSVYLLDTITGQVHIIACIALRAVGSEEWGTPDKFGTVQCPCTEVLASDAIVWMVDPADGHLVGRPWLRHPANVDAGAQTNMILAGRDGPGLRPPEQADFFSDIETFLGL